MLQSLSRFNNISAQGRYGYPSVPLSKNAVPDTFGPAKGNVSFGRWFPAIHNEEPIAKGIKMFEEAKSIVISGHKDHDGDSGGGSLGLGLALKKIYPDKKITIISAEPLKKGFKIVDPDSDVIHLSSDDEAVKYLRPDLFVAVDVAEKKQLSYQAGQIFDSAVKTLKIDHHPKNERITSEEFNFATHNIVDTSLESASQLVMQMIGPLGLVNKGEHNVDPKIANALGLGMLTDSGVFAHARGAEVFMDAHDWIKASGVKSYKDIRSNLFKKTPADYLLETAIRNKVQFTEDGKISYMLLGKEFDNDMGMAMAKNQLQNQKELEGVKHSFFVIERNDGTLKASLRSTSNIKHVAEQLGGGGHPSAPGIDNVRGKTQQQLFEEILEGLRKVD